MKYRLSIFALLTFTALSSCNAIDIFSSGDAETAGTARDDSTFLFVQITGGIAGVSQLFVVTESGAAVFEDSFGPGISWTKQLSAAEVQGIKTSMKENRFFDLENNYIDRQVADAFIYSINFQQGGLNHTVTTDNFGAPGNLQTIVSEVRSLIDLTRENGLEISLQLSKSEIASGKSVDMTLFVKNTTNLPLALRFNDGQIFDFRAFSTMTASPQDFIIWNWAHDQFFTQALWQLELTPGETKSYTVSWDGKGNDGTSQIGTFHIAASLVSRPGGSPAQQTLTIRE